ncbi:MAG TPA: hypothetical protein VEI97_07390 [bacterium]|nr:hypothetical protein [bacterium]
MVFRYDPEGKPRQLVTYLPDVAPALESLDALIHDPSSGFSPWPVQGEYLALRWKPGDQEALARVVLTIIRKTKDLATPDLGL